METSSYLDEIRAEAYAGGVAMVVIADLRHSLLGGISLEIEKRIRTTTDFGILDQLLTLSATGATPDEVRRALDG